MLLSEDEMEVTAIESTNPDRISEELLILEKKLKKLEAKNTSKEEEGHSTETGQFSIGDYGSNSTYSSSQTERPPKLHAIVITGEALVNYNWDIHKRYNFKMVTTLSHRRL